MEEKHSVSVPLEENLTCSICNDFYHEPVSLSCQHNFCCACLTKAWETKEDRTCPVCRRKSSRGLQPEMKNSTLKNIVEAYLSERAGQDGGEGRSVCARHRRKFRYFCKEKGEVVCSLCTEEEHGAHTHDTVEEAADLLKADLTSVMVNLQDNLNSLEEMRAVSEHTVEHIKTQTQQTAGRIKRAFSQLQQFLREEEEARLAALRREEAQKTTSLKDRVEQLTSQINSLSEKMADIKSKMATENVSFLQTYKDLKESALERLKAPEPEQVPGTLIDVVQHLANLQYNTWEKMQRMVQYAPVCLDENTAHPDLIISMTLLKVEDAQASQALPDNPERFDSMLGVLGSPGFRSGTHAWQVEVGNLTSWTLGVAQERVARKGVVKVNPEAGLWAVGLSNGSDYSAGTAEVGTPLALKRHPKRVLITLDCGAHWLSFHNAEDMTLIHTFKDVAEGMLYPYFSPCLNTDGGNAGALKICPEKVTVSKISVQGKLQ
ncbi:nuclear factor 7, brain-like [Sardina pilchardus]|uniref:nuclear factor 7, brain-like n=1 Tax=Sardina pilchardus TaxID=27697 RepID=UPI002E101ADA